MFGKWWIVYIQIAIILQAIIVVIAMANVHSILAILAHKIVTVTSAILTVSLLSMVLGSLLVKLKRCQRNAK